MFGFAYASHKPLPPMTLLRVFHKIFIDCFSCRIGRAAWDSFLEILPYWPYRFAFIFYIKQNTVVYFVTSLWSNLLWGVIVFHGRARSGYERTTNHVYNYIVGTFWKYQNSWFVIKINNFTIIAIIIYYSKTRMA